MTLTDVACGPFGPSSVSNSTFAPSGSDLKPSPLTALKWTNTSFPPSAGVMNPKPLASLNHLTVPVAIEIHLLTPKSWNGQRETRDAQPTLARSGPRVAGRQRQKPRAGPS